MKNYVINLLIFLGIALLFYTGIFDFFSMESVKIGIWVLVGVMFIIGFFVLGNPFKKGKDDDEDDTKK